MTLPKIGGVAIPEPVKLSTNLKKPKGFGGVADSNRVYFDGLEPPQLLPDGLISISSYVTEFPFETLGVVPVQHIFDINVTYAANVPGCGVFCKATVADMGEVFDGQQKSVKFSVRLQRLELLRDLRK